MPPKPKFTKEQIIETALKIVAEKGVEALTAKELGKALNTSTTPIFTFFGTMQEVQEAVINAAMRCFESYAHNADKTLPAFKQVGVQMISFAKNEPLLFQLIFMSKKGGVTPFDDHYAYLGGIADECLNAIQADYGLSAGDADTLFKHVWIHTYGIAVLCATGMCDFSQKQISEMLTQDFTAMMTLLKSKEQ